MVENQIKTKKYFFFLFSPHPQKSFTDIAHGTKNNTRERETFLVAFSWKKKLSN